MIDPTLNLGFALLNEITIILKGSTSSRREEHRDFLQVLTIEPSFRQLEAQPFVLGFQIDGLRWHLRAAFLSLRVQVRSVSLLGPRSLVTHLIAP